MKKNRGLSFLLAVLVFSTALLSACSSGLSLPEETEGAAVTQQDPTGVTADKAENKTEEEKPSVKAFWENPEEDDEWNVLLIGSSFAYRFPDELCAMAEERGIKIRVCHAYYSGVTLKTQWDWIRLQDGEYEFRHHGDLPAKGGIQKRLVDILRLYNWDVISVHQTPMGFRSGDYETSLKGCVYAQNIYNFLRERCPDARYMWYQIWGINVGYTVEDPTLCIPDRAKQIAMHNASHDVAREMVNRHGVDLVPAGDAWEIIRAETDIGDRLTGRGGTEYGDNLHDGDTGGGQYLNACVWFEVLFRKSCVGDTWRPTQYALDEAKIPLLQEAAHRAVADYWGEDYAK